MPNGCPCGFYGDPVKECTCTPSSVWRYKRRTSGPLLDRIDLFVEVPRIDHVGPSSHAQSLPQWREFTEAPIDHGYGEEETAKILGENVLRVLREAI